MRRLLYKAALLATKRWRQISLRKRLMRIRKRSRKKKRIRRDRKTSAARRLLNKEALRVMT